GRTESRQCSSAPLRPFSSPSLLSPAFPCVAPDAAPPPHSSPAYRRSRAPPQTATPTSALRHPEPALTQSARAQARSLLPSPSKHLFSYAISVEPAPSRVSSLRFLLRRFLIVSFLRLSVILVYRVLSSRTFQLHHNLHFRLVDLVVFPKSLETLRQYLHPQRTIRNPVNVRPPLPVRLQLQPSARLLALPIHRMQYHRRT